MMLSIGFNYERNGFKSVEVNHRSASIEIQTKNKFLGLVVLKPCRLEKCPQSKSRNDTLFGRKHRSSELERFYLYHVPWDFLGENGVVHGFWVLL
jgi:hypothetical protein